ncbi:AAA family ATPase [Alcanivorax quisquiliarum]|uniref:AAA family ATPase n=1 Tax=Alcanivorax quisquiliarum TaxID=2933565 RepID=A0ABT0E869_9GAMM|nr:AAA family ATPase [Alcanivorax quisquiliarum]MCK0538033.1 AAA family ATPase [Alcanivorax quisquiliarum]
MNVRKEITEVFTPRQGEVNTEMYVDRPLHEKSLARSLKRNSHTLLFGDSGNGKSWLYKKVMKENEIPYVVANCANASRLKSITQEICNCLIEPGTVTKLGFSEEKAAEVSAYFAKGGLKHSGNYNVSQEEPLLKAFKMFADTTPDRKIIVLDNLESIFYSKELMDELADIVILLDDDRYAACNINILIVGVPNGVLQYFSETKNLESVSNRIQEVEKVASLDSGQVMEIIRKGFDQLSIKITGQTLIDLSDHVWDVTLGIAQRVHEYCECLAYEVEDNEWKFEKALLQYADLSWLKQGLRQSYQVIEAHLNSRETAVARRNQVIYCIAKIRQHQFDSNDIDALIRKEFPSTIPVTNMGIGSILGELAKGGSPLLNRNEKNNSYSIRDPRYLMCIRVALYKDQVSERVIKKQFSR